MKKLLLFLAIIFSTHSHALEFQGKFLQGHFILGKAEAGSKVFVDKIQVKVSEDGYFVFGIDRDRKFDVAITEISNGKKNKIANKSKNFFIILLSNPHQLQLMFQLSYSLHLKLKNRLL